MNIAAKISSSKFFITISGYFSNFGPCVDILAPGSDIKSADFKTNDDAVSFSGTSMATPHVTGVIAR